MKKLLNSRALCSCNLEKLTTVKHGRNQDSKELDHFAELELELEKIFFPNSYLSSNKGFEFIRKIFKLLKRNKRSLRNIVCCSIVTRDVSSPSTQPSNKALLDRVRVLIDTRPSIKPLSF